MSHIVPLAEFYEALGSPEPSALGDFALDDAEALFEAECGHAFWPPKTGRIEVHDGTGTNTLHLHFPVSALTSVKLGYDPTTPDVELVVNDQSVLNWAVGSGRLVRVGGRFGCQGQPNYIQVVYNSQSNITESAKAAVKAAGSLIYNGAMQGVGSERIGGYSVDYAGGLRTLLESNDAWNIGVAANRWLVVA